MKKFIILCATFVVALVAALLLLVWNGAFTEIPTVLGTETTPSGTEAPLPVAEAFSPVADTLSAPADHVTAEWRALIKGWEGFTSEPINDCSFWAVGYGHQVCPVTESKPAPVTREEAEALFETDVAHWEAVALEWAAEHGFTLTQGELNALVSFLYQFGFRSDYMEKEGYIGSDFILWKQGAISAEDLREEWQEYCHYKDSDGVRHESAAIKARRLAEWREATK